MDVHAAISKSHCGKHYSQSLRVVCLLLSMYLINYQSVRLTEKKNKQTEFGFIPLGKWALPLQVRTANGIHSTDHTAQLSAPLAGRQRQISAS